MKRKVIAALLLGMAITVTGCSGNTTKDTDTTTEAASDASSETTADSSSESEAATEAAERPDYKALDYVKLGDYKGLEVTLASIDVTDEEVEQQVETNLNNNDKSEELKEGTVENGDVANIDYEGKLNGKAFIPQVKERIYPVGRLDWDTSGVLILTNDGDFTDEMIHPRNEIDKVYVARVKGLANKENLRPLTRGVTIDGKKTKPATYEILKVDPEKNRSVVQLTIHEGRNHQVKKMFEAVGLLVDKLSRTQFGNLDVSGLRPGEYRRLNKKEISQLHTLAVTKTKK